VARLPGARPGPAVQMLGGQAGRVRRRLRQREGGPAAAGAPIVRVGSRALRCADGSYKAWLLYSKNGRVGQGRAARAL